jgi:hypothetical protein
MDSPAAPVPDGMTQPMTDEDLVLCRRDRPDLDDRITFDGAEPAAPT